MSNSRLTYLMIGMVAVGAVLVASGVGGGAVLLLWPLACMAMMAAMMWGMAAMSHGGGAAGEQARNEDDRAERTHR